MATAADRATERTQRGPRDERLAHLRRKLPPGFVRVDCHVHTMWSGDSTTTPEELAEAVRLAGVDVVCITDHGTIDGAQVLEGVLPCAVVVGQEQRTPDGELIGLFLPERLPAGFRSAREAALAIRSLGGLVYAPHPYDPSRRHLRPAVLEALAGDGLLDVVEVRNAKTASEELNARAADLARRHALAAGAGSDAHVPEALGAAVVEAPAFEGPAGFLDSLRRGRVVGVHFDPPRRFAPRVVPSSWRQTERRGLGPGEQA